MTDFGDNCFGCGGHLRRNVYSGCLCPECEQRCERGEIDGFGRLTKCEGDPLRQLEPKHDRRAA
jgi:hypothetical protein